MDQIFEALGVVLPILIVISLGYFSKIKGILSSEGVSGLKGVVANFTLPVMLFGAFFNAKYSLGFWLCAIIMFALNILGMFIGNMVNKIFKMRNKYLSFFTSGFEAGMLGYGLFIMLFPDGISTFAMVDFGQALFVVTIFLFLLSVREKENFTIKKGVIQTLKSPFFIAIILGVSLGSMGLAEKIEGSAASDLLNKVIGFIGAPTSAIILFVVGYGFSLSRTAISRAMLTLVIRIAVMCFLCIAALFGFSLVTEVTPVLFWATIYMFAIAPSYALSIFSSAENEAEYISTTLSIYTFITLGVFAVITMLQ